jgi:outer membrane protein insertion porin family
LYFDRGDPYSRAKILKGASVLRKLGSFESVQVETIGLDEKQETVHLAVNVEERERYIVDLKASYSTDDKLTGVLALHNLDVLGLGKRMSLFATLGFDKRGGELNYIDPHLLGGDFEMVLSGFIENEDRPSFDETRFGGSISFLRDIGRTMTVLGRYQVERSIFHGGTPDPDEETSDRTLPHFRGSFNYDTRDYFADPRKGLFVETSADYFHRFFEISANFFKLRGQINYYLSPHPRFTFVNSLRMAGAIPVTASAVIPRSELFFVGGDYSIRGFDQDKAGPLDATGTPTGQKFMFIWNSEMQLRLAGKFKIAAFFDTASVAQSFKFSMDSLRHSAGVGLRYITPVGPIRLDYGVILDPRPDEETGRLHFTFGYAF